MGVHSSTRTNILFLTHCAFATRTSQLMRAALPAILFLTLAPIAAASNNHAGKTPVSKTNETLFLELQQDIPSVDFVATPVIEEFVDPISNLSYFKVPLTLLQAGQYNVGLDGVLGITMKKPYQLWSTAYGGVPSEDAAKNAAAISAIDTWLKDSKAPCIRDPNGGFHLLDRHHRTTAVSILSDPTYMENGGRDYEARFTGKFKTPVIDPPQLWNHATHGFPNYTYCILLKDYLGSGKSMQQFWYEMENGEDYGYGQMRYVWSFNLGVRQDPSITPPPMLAPFGKSTISDRPTGLTDDIMREFGANLQFPNKPDPVCGTTYTGAKGYESLEGLIQDDDDEFNPFDQTPVVFNFQEFYWANYLRDNVFLIGSEARGGNPLAPHQFENSACGKKQLLEFALTNLCHVPGAARLPGFFQLPCAGDLNKDGVIDMLDFSLCLLAWGNCDSGQPCEADLDYDGMVSGSDCSLILIEYGTGCSPTKCDCVIIDNDFDIDDMMAIPLVIGNKYVASIIQSEGYTMPQQAAAAIDQLINQLPDQPNQRKIPIIVGAKQGANGRQDLSSWPWLPYFRTMMNLSNGLLSTPPEPAPVGRYYPEQVAVSVANCSKVSVLIIGTYSSFINYYPHISSKIDKVVIMGQEIGDDSTTEGRESFNCRYDLEACQKAMVQLDELKLNDVPGTQGVKVPVVFVDIPRISGCNTASPSSDCYTPSYEMVAGDSGSTGLTESGLPLRLKQALINNINCAAFYTEPLTIGNPCSSLSSWVPADVFTGPGGEMLLWDQTASLCLLHPELFALYSPPDYLGTKKHYEPILVEGSHALTIQRLRRLWTEDTNRAVTFYP